MTSDPPVHGMKRISLRRYLLRWAMSAVVLVWLSLVMVGWYTGYEEANEVADGQLISASQLVLQAPPPSADGSAAERRFHKFRNTYAIDVAIVQWVDGQLVQDSHDLARELGLSAALAKGFATAVGPARTVGEEAHETSWRLYVAKDTDVAGHARVVAALLDVDRRFDMGRDVAAHVAQPALLLLPLAAVLLWWAILRGLQPLQDMSSRVAQLDGRAGERLDEGQPFTEFRSTVTAINTLVDSLQLQAEQERAFASDVAHELRTPLAAIALNARNAQTAASPAVLAELEAQSLKAGRILQQLLDLARAQRNREGLVQEADLVATSLQLLSDMAPNEFAAEHELSLEAPQDPVCVAANPMLVELALRNLIDNAVRHTSPGTQVRVDVWRDEAGVHAAVSDDGQRHQVPAEDIEGRSAVASPAMASERAADKGGLGLGLRLVDRLAASCGATLTRDRGEPPMTTRFMLSWSPAACRSSRDGAPDSGPTEGAGGAGA